MGIAFLILSINQIVNLNETSHALCVFTAVIQMFSFLAAFTFMTIMSVETYKRIRKTVEISAVRSGNIFSFIRNCTSIVNSTTLGSSERLLSDVMFRDQELSRDQNPRRDRIHHIKTYRAELLA